MRTPDAKPASSGGAQPRDIAPLERHGAVVGARGAGQQVEQRSLARAVWPDDSECRSRVDLNRYVIEHDQRAEALADPADGEDWLGGR